MNVADPGCFTWLLMESSSDEVVFDVEVAASEHPFPSYSEALRHGYDALLATADSKADSKADGPRASGEDENREPVTEGGHVGDRTAGRSRRARTRGAPFNSPQSTVHKRRRWHDPDLQADFPDVSLSFQQTRKLRVLLICPGQCS
jgi:hypothetical protein